MSPWGKVDRMDSQKNEKLKKSTFDGMLWIFGERISAKLVSFCVTLVLARLLVPEDYSVISVTAIFFTFCNVIINGGLNTALVQKKNADSLDYSSVLCVTVTMAAMMYVAAFLAAPWIAKLYDKEQLTTVVRVMALSFFIMAFKSVLNAYTSSHLQFRKFFFATIVGTVISAAVGIGMALKGFGAWALVAQEMTNNLIDTLMLLATTHMEVRLRCSFGRLKSLFSFGIHNFASSLVSVIYDQVSPLVIGLRFSTVDLAFYTKGQSFPGLINTTLSETMSEVLFPVMTKVQDNLEDIRNVTRRYMKTSTYVIFPIMVGLVVVANTFVRLLLTEKWMSCAIYIQIFSVSYMLGLIAVGTIQALRAIGRSDVVLKLEMAKKALSLVVLVSFILLAKRPEALAVCSAVCSLLAFCVNAIPARKILGYGLGNQVRDLLPNLLLSLLMAVPVALLGRLPIPDLALLPLQVLTGAVVYVGLSILLKNENLRFVLNTLRQRLGF